MYYSNVLLHTIELYLSYFIDAFLIQKAERYDVKGN